MSNNDFDIDLEVDQATEPVADALSFALKRERDDSWRLYGTPTGRAIEIARSRDPDFLPGRSVLLAEFHAPERCLRFYPRITYPHSRRFLAPKYPIRTITMEKVWEFEFPGGPPWRFEGLPTGFHHGAAEGFGVLAKNIEIIRAAGLLGVTDLTLNDDVPSPVRVRRSLRVSYAEFDRLRRAIQRLHAAAVQVARGDKAIYLYNHLVSPVDPEQYPPKPNPYQKDALHRAAAAALAAPGRLSPRDQRAAIRIIRTELSDIAAREETELLELNREIELVTLETVIAKMAGMLEKHLGEAKWQSFLLDNPFILRLAFGLPIMVFGEQVAVGGGQFTNRGTKVADLVVKSGGFGNLAIIEIKTPDTELVETRAYRANVHAPTRELSGGVTQVLDQRYMLSLEIDQLKARSLKPNVWSYALKCVVVAGRQITDPNKHVEEARRKSFEFYRHQLADVTIITFDELIEKLRALLAFLKPAQ